MRLWMAPLGMAVVLLIGLHVLPAWVGTVGLLALLIVTGLGVRLLKLFTGGMLILFGLS